MYRKPMQFTNLPVPAAVRARHSAILPLSANIDKYYGGLPITDAGGYSEIIDRKEKRYVVVFPFIYIYTFFFRCKGVADRIKDVRRRLLEAATT